MWISHFWNPVPKVTLGIGDLILGIKTKLFFYLCASMFDLDLWLSVMSCGVMSTITSTYTYRKKTPIKKITR
jgi:hypothetical protein